MGMPTRSFGLVGTSSGGRERLTSSIDPALFEREDVRRVLAERDIGALFHVLRDDAGLTQRQLAECVGMSQSEVSEITKGRRVQSYDVLVRIATGLGVPRELMGLSYTDGPRGAYGGDQGPEPEVDEAVQRRKFLSAVMASSCQPGGGAALCPSTCSNRSNRCARRCRHRCLPGSVSLTLPRSKLSSPGCARLPGLGAGKQTP